MALVLLPAIWLIVFIVGLPQLSETVYTPSLPEIATGLNTAESLVEYTLTIYLFGFAIGTLFWGKISDKFGRKPCIVAGLCIFILGCIGCYNAYSIDILMFSRFIQAFGGSTGSVLGQAVCRDAFHGPSLGKVYALIGSRLAVFPAIGPMIGGFITEHFEWYNIFLFLMVVAVLLLIIVIKYLPETHRKADRQPIALNSVIQLLTQDKKVISLGLIVAACNGIMFSYYAEGSFYLIKLLGLAPSKYGLSFILIAFFTMLGGLTSKQLHSKYSANQIMGFGIVIIAIASALFSLLILGHVINFYNLTNLSLIIITILIQTILMFGVCMVQSNALATALIDYKWCIGTASSLFGFYYYCGISFFTFVMGFLHNGTLVPMPLYFFAISLLMLLIKQLILTKAVD